MEKYSALLAVDAKNFSSHRDSQLPDLHMEIRRVLQESCEASGLGEVWESIRFKESTGDGILAILPHTVLPALIAPFAQHLQDALAKAAPGLRTRRARLRLRAALHVGLVDDERPEAPGISTATIDVCRLLDSQPLQDALDHSDPDVTFVAFLLSEEVFASYVEGGRTTLQPSQFTRVQIKVKRFSRPAHLYVPAPSTGDRRPPEAPGGDGPEPVDPAPRRGPSTSGVSITGDGSQNAIGNSVGGDFRMRRS